MKKVIKIFYSNQINSSIYEEAESLAKSWGDMFINFEVLQGDRNIVFKSDYTAVSKFANSELIKLLDSVDSVDELLILPLCLKDEVAEYVNNREKINLEVDKWHIVYNNFKRYAFLESNRDLSSNIPKDTVAWIKQLINKYSKREVINSLNFSSS